MLERVPTRPGVVPLESFVDIRGPADVVSRRIAVASEDIDESSANTLHVDRRGIFCASENYEEFRGRRLESIAKHAEVNPFE